MSIKSFLAILNKKNIGIELIDDELKIKAKKGVLTDELILEIKAKKQQIIHFLDSQNETRYTFKSYMNLVRFLVQQLIHNHFGEIHFPDNTELTRWETGRSMGVHSDNSWPDGSQTDHPTSFRTWSAIYYINDLYEGGEIYFPRLDWSWKPEANTVLIFPSDNRFLHGVTEVTKGERYTIAMWYTQDFRYLEI